MTLEVIITAVLGFIGTIVGAWSSYFFTKKKYNAEVDGAKIENLLKVIDILTTQIENLNERQSSSMERNKQLEEEVVALRREMFNMLGAICYDLTCKNRVASEKDPKCKMCKRDKAKKD